MLGEAFLIIIVSSALNGAICYGLYTQIKQDISQLAKVVNNEKAIGIYQEVDKSKVADGSQTVRSNRGMVESTNEDRLSTPDDLTPDIATSHSEICIEQQAEQPEEITLAINEAIEMSIVGERAQIVSTYENPLTECSTLHTETEASGETVGINCKSRSKSSFLDLGSWLWRQDKSIARQEVESKVNTDDTSSKNA